MTDTYEDYLKYLTENTDSIREGMIIEDESPLREIYLQGFIDNFHQRGEGKFQPGNISATDSSEFVRELYNGKKLILIRAFAKSRNHVAKDFICEVINVNRDDIRNFSILLMEHTEHLATRRLLEENKPEFVLMDGSLIGRLYHKRNRIDAEKYENFMEEYFRSLYELISDCIKLKIPMVFIAKSSETSMLRRYILDHLGNQKMAAEQIAEEKREKRTDHLLIKSFAEESGYTTPLRVSMEVGRNDFGLDKINVVTFHALPDSNDLPIKVDLILPEAQEGLCEKAEKYPVPELITDMIFWGYGGLKTHNIWLADVDREVKFRQKEVEELYMRTFERIIGVPFYETRGERRARIRI